MENKKYFKLLLKYLKSEKYKIFMYIFLSIFIIVPSIVVPYFYGLSLDYLIVSDFKNFIKYILVAGISSIVCYCLIALRINIIYYKIENTVQNKLVKDLYNKVSNLEAISFEKTSVGEFNNKIFSDSKTIVELFFKYLDGIYYVFELVIVLIITFTISKIVGLLMLILCILLYSITKYYVPKLKENQTKLSSCGDLLMKKSTENIYGIREIKSLGIKPEILKNTFNQIDDYTDKNMKLNIFSTNYHTHNKFIFNIFKLIILLTLGYLYIGSEITIALYLMMQNYIWNLQVSVDNICRISTSHSKILVALKRINSVLSDELYNEEEFGKIEIKNPKGKVKFENVNFKYEEKDEYTLENLSVEFLENKKNAIVGHSGNGKTTIFNLLQKFFIAEGKITIDDINIIDLTEQSLRENISVIRQQPFLFNLSIKENLNLKKIYTDKQIIEACKKSYIHDYIMGLDEKYDTIIGEGGVNLSGGQKQRLAIARVILQNTKIILFDEATSALDNKSENYIKKMIDELSKNHTVIIIAHRLTTIKDADQIYIMENKKITTKGTHDELIKTSKTYKELYKNENKNDL